MTLLLPETRVTGTSTGRTLHRVCECQDDAATPRGFCGSVAVGAPPEPADWRCVVCSDLGELCPFCECMTYLAD